MTRFILDTDTVSLFQRGHPTVTAHVLATASSQIAVTIVTAEEQLRGRLTQVRRAAGGETLVQTYARLYETLNFFCHVPILGFDEQAAATFDSLRQNRLRVGTLDLRIAAIVLSVDGTVITRNTRDFGRVPALHIEDWTIP